MLKNFLNFFLKPSFRELAPDDLSELESETVPEEVRKWLASTFAKQEQLVRRKEERPTFRSVANAIRSRVHDRTFPNRILTVNQP